MGYFPLIRKGIARNRPFILNNFARTVNCWRDILGYIQVSLETAPYIGRINFVSVHAFLPQLQISFHHVDFQAIEFQIIKHASITDFCLESPCLSPYMLLWTICWLWLSDPPSDIDQRLLTAPSVKDKHTGTSGKSHIKSLTPTYLQSCIRTPRYAPDVDR